LDALRDYATAAPMLIRSNALRHVGKAWTAFDDAWRKVSRNEIGWTLAIALTFTIAHAYSLNTAQGRSWPVPVRVYEWLYVPFSLIFLVAFRFAEHTELVSLAALCRSAVRGRAAVLVRYAVGRSLDERKARHRRGEGGILQWHAGLLGQHCRRRRVLKSDAFAARPDGV
jgi:hypothetical protein